MKGLAWQELSRLSLCQLGRNVAERGAAATKQANDALYKQLPSPTTPTLPTRIKVLLPRSYGSD
jgi:hypothetical protein